MKIDRKLGDQILLVGLRLENRLARAVEVDASVDVVVTFRELENLLGESLPDEVDGTFFVHLPLSPFE